MSCGIQFVLRNPIQTVARLLVEQSTDCEHEMASDPSNGTIINNEDLRGHFFLIFDLGGALLLFC